ncbi:Uncharacterized protein ALO75_05364 [Pseudomonas syringae pv. coryli]|uniref:Uncharacterized protein n=1 Tax=Pseudomonas syringae pv. coryli TaxID=317659 RepID=A0A0P9SMI9_9PSED|nr:Uncharacterized protein ALO75_05364 [Pseudomonas syringae pv. coryli]
MFQHVLEHAWLTQRVLATVGVAAIDHDSRRDIILAQARLYLGHTLVIVIGAAVTAAQHDVRIRIALCLDNRRVAMTVHAKVAMWMRSRTHRVAGHRHAAISTVLEPDSHGQAAGHFPMDLRFGGASANRDPTEQIVEVARRHGLQYLGGDRQAQAQHLQHQLPRQRQALGHVVAAVKARIVSQAFPAHRRARFFDVSAHYQQHLITDLRSKTSQSLSVFKGGSRVVDRAGADDDQQSRVLTFKDGAYGAAMGGNLFGERCAEGQTHLQFQSTWQAFRGGAVVCQLDGVAGQVGRGYGNGRVHVLASWAGGTLPRRPYWGVRQRLSRTGGMCLPPGSDRTEAAGCPERRWLNRQAKSMSLR